MVRFWGYYKLTKSEKTKEKTNNQNRYSERGTTAENLSNYLKIQRCAMDDGNQLTKVETKKAETKKTTQDQY